MTEAPRTPSGADALVDDLARDGVVDSRGRFDVDPARARELLSSFRLADPTAWAAELIQSATILHASRFDTDVTRDRVTIAFDGEPFTREELELADSALLSRVENPRQRAVAQLAAALAGARAGAPGELRVTSGGCTLVQRPGQPDRLEPAEPAPGTLVIMRRRAGTAAELPEAAALERKGRHADLRLTVNGAPVSQGLRLPDSQVTVPLAGEGWSSSGEARLAVAAILEGSRAMGCQAPAPPVGTDGLTAAPPPLISAYGGFERMRRPPGTRAIPTGAAARPGMAAAQVPLKRCPSIYCAPRVRRPWSPRESSPTSKYAAVLGSSRSLHPGLLVTINGHLFR
jgi:hypothetical protein